MTKAGTWSLTYCPPASLREWIGPSIRNGPACRHDSQGSEWSGANHGCDGGSTPHNESFQPLWCEKSERAPTSPGEKSGRRRFQCTLCPERKPYASNSSLRRHYRREHQSGFKCPHCDDYEWTASRRYLYKEHLKKHGLEDDEIKTILTQPPIPRVIKNDLSAPNFLLSPIEQDRQGLDELPQRLLMPPFLEVAYNLWLRHSEPTELELLAPTLAPSGLLSEGDSALINGHFIIHRRRFRFVYASFICDIYDGLCPQISVTHRGGSTTADISPNPGMLHVPALPSPVDGYTVSD